jgi:hypothetical protein
MRNAMMAVVAMIMNHFDWMKRAVLMYLSVRDLWIWIATSSLVRTGAGLFSGTSSSRKHSPQTDSASREI